MSNSYCDRCDRPSVGSYMLFKERPRWPGLFEIGRPDICLVHLSKTVDSYHGARALD